jgi:hypothetical protein
MIDNELELAINSYLDTRDSTIFKPFIGKCKGSEPYGEEELGKAINKGDITVIDNVIDKLSTFTDDKCSVNFADINNGDLSNPFRKFLDILNKLGKKYDNKIPFKYNGHKHVSSPIKLAFQVIRTAEKVYTQDPKTASRRNPFELIVNGKNILNSTVWDELVNSCDYANLEKEAS